MPSRRFRLGAAPAAALAFALLARWVLAGESMLFDLRIRGAVHAWASPVLTGAMLAVTMLGSEWVMLPLGAVSVWCLATKGRGRQAILLAVGGLGAESVSALLKLAFHRPRPPVFFGLSPAENYSFPSGHAFVATVFYGLLAGILLESSRRWRWIAPVLTIGFSRVYLGYHYPTDVLGGWACAAIWLALSPPVNPAGQTQKQRH